MSFIIIPERLFQIHTSLLRIPWTTTLQSADRLREQLTKRWIAFSQTQQLMKHCDKNNIGFFEYIWSITIPDIPGILSLTTEAL